jgi:ABC-type maltose transport system permease subunit
MLGVTAAGFEFEEITYPLPAPQLTVMLVVSFLGTATTFWLNESTVSDALAGVKLSDTDNSPQVLLTDVEHTLITVEPAVLPPVKVMILLEMVACDTPELEFEEM